MSALSIYNCHIHTLTAQHVPERFLPLWLRLIAGWRPALSALLWVVRYVDPWDSGDLLERQARFLSIGSADGQAEIFDRIRRQYPSGTKFVILPMDMAFMGAGRVRADLDAQHAELLRLKARYPDDVIAFCAVDPRRDGVVERAKRWIARDGFQGVKLYPNLGYYPHDPVLMQLYEFLEERGVPVLAHCSPGGVWSRDLSQAEAAEFAHPRHYLPILEKFPRLRVCLAHFGGNEEWERHLNIADEPDGADQPWVQVIREMIQSGKYPGLYTDISYTIFAPRVRYRPFDYFDYLKVLLADPQLRQRVLYGSDYYMVARERMTEKEASIALRSRLGEDLYFQIAHHNPRRYLGLD